MLMETEALDLNLSKFSLNNSSFFFLLCQI